MNDRILAERRAHGWSQTELARRAGVTRQLVSAVEAGRHVPGVAAALSLAGALETSVERLFATTSAGALDALGTPPAVGTAVGVGRVGDRLVSAPRTFGADGPEGWGVPDAVVTDGGLEWLPGSSAAELVLAGCDPVLDLATGLLERSGRRVLAVHASTGRSIDALAAGRVHGALVHARPGDLPAPPVPVRRWQVARWQVGLAGPTPEAVPSIDELAVRRLDVVQRDVGAGAQQALVRALRASGVEAGLPGPVGHGHVDVARRVSYGGGAAGVVMEAAAVSLGLGFAPLEEHAVELWIAEEWATLPAAQAFVEVLGSEALVRRSRLLPGYDPSGCGSELRTA